MLATILFFSHLTIPLPVFYKLKLKYPEPSGHYQSRQHFFKCLQLTMQRKQLGVFVKVHESF